MDTDVSLVLFMTYFSSAMMKVKSFSQLFLSQTENRVEENHGSKRSATEESYISHI